MAQVKIFDTRRALTLATALLVPFLSPNAIAWAQAEPPIDSGESPPPIAREFRGVWVASVRNIDWPSRPGLSVERQKGELLQLLDRAAALKLNAVVLQVRPACDALYDSPLEPWSEYLTGRQGQPPAPYYDPLQFAVAEAHARGLELHAWVNPYRARLIDDNQGPADPRHLSVAKPQLVKRYGKQLWLDPGEPEVQDHSLNVIRDIVHRYDIDAIHMDDYFYPYKESAPGGGFLPFPDDPSFARYQASGGSLGRDDWRRDNVNRFVDRLYKVIKAEKPQVKLGISPFGIWKPGYPAQIKGMNQYEMIYADAKLWLERGWVDYFAPQLYWSIENPDQSYPVLLQWWADQNKQGRHLWPGLFTSRVKEPGDRAWQPRQIAYQVMWTRLQPGATGHIHFSMRPLAEDTKGLGRLLAEEVYKAPAIVPRTPWLPTLAPVPQRPRLTISKNLLRGTLDVSFEAMDNEKAAQWVVYTKREGHWSSQLVGPRRAEVSIKYGGTAGVEAVDVSLVDRDGQESPHARIVIKPEAEGGPVPQP